jgi:hypothetical protein
MRMHGPTRRQHGVRGYEGLNVAILPRQGDAKRIGAQGRLAFAQTSIILYERSVYGNHSASPAAECNLNMPRRMGFTQDVQRGFVSTAKAFNAFADNGLQTLNCHP